MSDPIDIKTPRQALSKKLRFEVFKRDRFTCQYCGESAPEVVLNCDHIHPVAEGGLTDILNLITSCKACNAGKGAVPLSNSAVLDKQKAMLIDLEDRRQQIEMMLEWRNGLALLKDDTIDLIVGAMARGGYEPNERHREIIRKWLRSYSTAELFRAIDEAFDIYLVAGDIETWKKAFAAVTKFARMAREDANRPYLRKLLYIQGILRNRTGEHGMLAFLEQLHLAGASLEDLEEDAKSSNRITHFTTPWYEWLALQRRST